MCVLGGGRWGWGVVGGAAPSLLSVVCLAVYLLKTAIFEEQAKPASKASVSHLDYKKKNETQLSRLHHTPSLVPSWLPALNETAHKYISDFLSARNN